MLGIKWQYGFFLGCYIYDDVQNTLPKNTRYSDKGQFWRGRYYIHVGNMPYVYELVELARTFSGEWCGVQF